jgi:thioredoxin-dependent peroxiredoxin
MTDTLKESQPHVRSVTFHGESYALAGELPAIGVAAPNFTVCAWQNATKVDVTLQSLLAPGRPLLLSVFASVDTPVSRLQLKNFDNALAQFGDLATGVHISSDLPFTIRRVFGNEEIDYFMGLSDYLDRNFGSTYGVLLADSQVLARAVFVIDGKGILRYAELLPEVTFQPDYLAALGALSECCEWPAASEAGDEQPADPAAT